MILMAFFNIVDVNLNLDEIIIMTTKLLLTIMKVKDQDESFFFFPKVET